MKRLKAENRRLREDVEILQAATTFFAATLGPPQPLIMGFIAKMNVEEGFAIDSICRAPRLLGERVAARTYRWWKQAGRPFAARTVTDAVAPDTVWDLVSTVNHRGERITAPEGLYDRRKMLALVRRRGLPTAVARHAAAEDWDEHMRERADGERVDDGAHADGATE